MDGPLIFDEGAEGRGSAKKILQAKSAGEKIVQDQSRQKTRASVNYPDPTFQFLH